jgi:hypothetical protein
MSEPLVYVIVVNWNGERHLRECFDSLLASDYGNARFLLIDNASSDGSVEVVHQTCGSDPRVDVIGLAANLGWSGGNNAGIQRALEAGADYVFLLNNDTVTEPGAISQLVEMAERRHGIGALAPKMLLYDNPEIINSLGLGCSIIASSWDIGIGRLDGPRWNEPNPVIGVCGGAAFFKAEALRKAGPFPEDFTIYLDDLDLCLRIWNAGYEISSCPQARVRHKFSATMGQTEHQRRKYYLLTRNRLYLMLRNFPCSKALRIGPAFCLGEAKAVGRSLLDGQSWRAGVHVRAWGSALAYLPHAWAERRRRRRAGQGACRFWRLVRTDCLFFPGTEFPEDGWYPPCTVAGRTVRPISSRAWLEFPGGRLQVTHVNCYPRLGSTSVEVRSNGQSIAVLETFGSGQTVLELAPGTVEFIARRLFAAEATGAAVDIGGWISTERL